jgi:hypothetical protein
VLRILRSSGLHAFALLHDVIHCDARGYETEGRAYLARWSPAFVVHPAMAARDEAVAPARWSDEPIVAAMGVGAREFVYLAQRELELAPHTSTEPELRPARLEVAPFPLEAHRDIWALRVRPGGHCKGSALARLARRLGCAREGVAAVGDWINDVGMLSWAGRSFAMAQAPDVVRSAATDVLDASSRSGGGVAEALARWLGRDWCTFVG